MAYQYKVVELRADLRGSKMSGEKLEALLNEHGAQGWQVKAVVSVQVEGRIGKGGTDGLMVTFERTA